MAYREAYSSDTAQAVVDYLVNTRGLENDRDAIPEAERRSASAGPQPRVAVLPLQRDP